MKTALAISLLAPLAVIAEKVVPKLEMCTSVDQQRVLTCTAKSTPTDCNASSDCAWCTNTLSTPPGVTAALINRECDATGDSCRCSLPGISATATPTPLPTASPAAGYCAPKKGSLVVGCEWKSVATLSTGATVSCGSISWDSGCARSSSGSGSISLPLCNRADSATAACLAGQTGSGDASTCRSGCNKCKYDSEGVSTTVCLPAHGTDCKEEALGSIHLAYSSDTCPKLAGKEKELTGQCKAAMIRYFGSSRRSDCQSLMSSMEGVEGVGMFSESRMESLCKNKCMWGLVASAERLASKCETNDLKDTEGQNSAAMVSKMMSVMCYKNEAGKYCGTAMADMGQASRVKKRLAMASVITGTEVNYPVTPAAIATAREILLDMGRKYTKSHAIKSLQTAPSSTSSPGSGVQLDCSQIDQIKPQFEQLKSVLGCCMGELFRVMLDPAVATAEDSNMMALMVGLLKECGLDLTEGTCIKPIEEAAKLKATMKLRIKNYKEANKEEFKVAVQADIASNLGIPKDRVVITEFKVNGARKVAKLQSDADVEVSYTIIGDQTDSAGLETIKSEIDSSTFVMSNTDIEAGGNGDGKSAEVTEAPEVESIEKASSEESSSATAMAAPVTMATATVLATALFL